VAVDHYLALTKAVAIAAAETRVRAAKESNASQTEVDAAVAAYLALTQPAAPRVAAQAPAERKEEVVVEESVRDPVEDIAAKVRQLKADHAPEAAVKAVVAEYVSLQGLPAAKAVEVAVQSPAVDAAEKVVQALKAKMASQDEVRAAVEAYLALKYPSRAVETKHAERQEGGAQTPLEAAMTKVRALKAAKASQEEVTAAVAEYRRLLAAADAAKVSLEEAIAKVRALKEARASQAEVSAAVAEYRALLAANGAAPVKAEEVKEPTPAVEVATPLVQAAEQVSAEDTQRDAEEPTVRVHLPDPSE
jgi:hypothetical protein